MRFYRWLDDQQHPYRGLVAFVIVQFSAVGLLIWFMFWVSAYAKLNWY